MGLWQDEHILRLGDLDLSPADKRAALEEADAVAALASRVSVSPIFQSTLVKINVDDSLPHLAIQLANEVAEAYKDNNLNYRQRMVAEATQRLEALTQKERRA